jgi:hypothetical protein
MFISPVIFPGEDNGIFYKGMGMQLVFDFSQFDTEPPYFYLAIDTAQELDDPIRQPPRKIPGFVKFLPPAARGGAF